jgi:hypothetical protein
VEHEEQAVNLRRQKKDKIKGTSVRCATRSNSNTSVGGSSKPDNIAQSVSEVERTRDIQHKTRYVSDMSFKPLPYFAEHKKILFYLSMKMFLTTCSEYS